MKFDLNFYDRQISNNRLEAKRYVRANADIYGKNYIISLMEIIKEIYNSFSFTKTISKNLYMDDDSNIVLDNKKIDLEQLLRGRVVIYFEINPYLSLNHDITDKITDERYVIDEIIELKSNNPYTIYNLDVFYPMMIGKYRVRIVNSIEYNYVMRKHDKKEIDREGLIRSSFWFDFIDGINRIIQLSSQKEMTSKILIDNDLENRIKDFFK